VQGGLDLVDLFCEGHLDNWIGVRGWVARAVKARINWCCTLLFSRTL